MTNHLLLMTASLCAFAMLTARGEQDSKRKSDEIREFAVIESTFGTIEFELFRSDAPRTVENFVGLAKKKYYDGVVFHRVARGFVIQGGDPTGSGAGGESLWGPPFVDELNTAMPSYARGYVKGVVAMANRGPNTNTSQFFILLNDAPHLPKNYTIFGRVTKGMEVVEKIGALEVSGPRAPNDGRPVQSVTMKSVRIRTQPAAGPGPEKSSGN